MKYTYKDFLTGKVKWTRGRFAGWTKGGILNATYAVFQRRTDTIYVPAYCLTPETRQAIGDPA